MSYKDLEYKGLTKAYRNLGVNYLGNVNHSSKLIKGAKKNYATYGVYLASSDSSGVQVCSDDKGCKAFCLAESGMAKIELLGGLTKIKNSRIKKSLLYGQNIEFFTRMLVDEIRVKNYYQKLMKVNFV